MANYLYNGITAPELPEWDKVSDPNALMGYSPLYAYKDILFLFATQLASTVDGSGEISSVVADHIWYLYNGVWTESTGIISIVPKWSNYDIYTTDGTLYLAASDPIPIDPIDPAVMMMGVLVGKKIKGQRAQTPIAYLYNGVQLPPLPEWDRETYPYVIISGLTETGKGCYSATVSFYSEKFHYEPLGGRLYLLRCDLPFNYQRYTWDNMDFSFSNNYVLEEEGYSNSGYAVTGVSTFWWANYDVYDTDGNLYQATSNPIPVYT